MKTLKQFKVLIFLLLIWRLNGFNLLAGDNTLPSYTVHKTATTIKLDGIPNEAAWRSAAPSPLFLEIEKGTPPFYPVTAKMLWDDKYLYLSFRISDPNLWAKKCFRDFPMAGNFLPDVLLLKKRKYKEKFSYTENLIKIYLDPDNDGKNYTETHVNPSNIVCDKWQETPWRKKVCERMGIKRPSDGVKIHPDWNCPGMKTAVHIDGTLNDPYDVDNGWTVEVAIPFESLKFLSDTQNFPPRPGDVWRIHLGRRYAPCYGADASYWTWPVIGEGDCHTPDRWGYAVFAGPNKKTMENAYPAMPKLNVSAQKAPMNFAGLPKAAFNWKALWSDQIKTHKEADELIRLTKVMNCNVIIVYTADSGKAVYESSFLKYDKGIEAGTLKYLIEQAHKNNIKVHSWFVNLRTDAEFAKKHPELLQKCRDWEDENAKLPRIDPGRANVHTGNWLCPDRGLTEYEKKIIGEIFSNFDFDGFAFDYVGYRNYYACFCDYSRQRRQEFADKHPDISVIEIMRRFSEESLVKYVTEVREFVRSLKPSAEFSIHIYPDFDLNPVYGNRLPVESCGQTIAWFYKPFWSYGKVYDTCMKYKNAQGKFVKYNKFVPFVGVYDRDKLKTPERLRTEIRIAGLAENGTIMLASDRIFRRHPELVKVVAEELK
ncbi:MAG: family 10 glycosylhydrolase [Victivallaceae bacterium]|nr:family 10 glycosylhydrolase [Victivallaceae bacterium]